MPVSDFATVLSFQTAICKALRIDPMVTESVVFDLRADEVPRVVVTQYVSLTTVDTLRRIFEMGDWHEIAPKPETEPES